MYYISLDRSFKIFVISHFSLLVLTTIIKLNSPMYWFTSRFTMLKGKSLRQSTFKYVLIQTLEKWYKKHPVSVPWLKGLLDSTGWEKYEEWDLRVVFSPSKHQRNRTGLTWKYSYNHLHNFLRLFDVLPNFPFTTSEAMCDYYL